MNYLKLVVVIAAILISPIVSHAQVEDATSDNPVYAQQAVYGTYSFLLISMRRITYEAMVIKPIKGINTSISLRVDAGIVYTESGRNWFSGLGITTLTGKGNTKVEANFGWIYSPSTTIALTGAFGVRYQKNKGGLIGRFGAGYPEIAYVGVGYAF